MPWLNVVLLVYGLIDIGMGVLGYASKGSIMSLIAGGLLGLIVIATVPYSKVNPRAARITALVVTVLMMGQFAKGTFVDNKLYPAGIMFVISLAVFGCLLIGHIMGMKAKRAREASTK